jgi:hypothetical protein
MTTTNMFVKNMFVVDPLAYRRRARAASGAEALGPHWQGSRLGDEVGEHIPHGAGDSRISVARRAAGEWRSGAVLGLEHQGLRTGSATQDLHRGQAKVQTRRHPGAGDQLAVDHHPLIDGRGAEMAQAVADRPVGGGPQEEQFGPVLPLLKVDSIDEAIERANASEYGLGGSVWSADAEAALAVGQRLQTGTVWINETQHLSPLASFAGHKQSGLGVENGLDGLLEYTNTLTIVVREG